jgi:hypothetical protein
VENEARARASGSRERPGRRGPRGGRYADDGELASKVGGQKSTDEYMQLSSLLFGAGAPFAIDVPIPSSGGRSSQKEDEEGKLPFRACTYI